MFTVTFEVEHVWDTHICWGKVYYDRNIFSVFKINYTYGNIWEMKKSINLIPLFILNDVVTCI